MFLLKIYRFFRNKYLDFYNVLLKTSFGKKFLVVPNILVETTSYCNLRCEGCYRTIHDYGSKNKHMSYRFFKKIIDELPRTKILYLHGLGEPTLNPEFPRMIKYANSLKKFKTITFTTNAQLKNKKVYDEMFRNGLSSLIISVDSLNEKTLNKIRLNTDKDLLLDNVKYLAKRHKKKITCNVVVSKDNIDELEKIIQKLIDIDVKKIFCLLFEDFGGFSSRCLSKEEEEKLIRVLDSYKGYKGVSVCGNSKATKKVEPLKPCMNPTMAPSITVDGFLTPCCYILDKDIVNYGDLKTNSFHKLFSSKKYKELQNNIEKGNYPGFCISCNLNHVLNNKGDD